MVVDNWAGLGVYRSKDMLNWEKQNDRLLEVPGKGLEDGSIGGHPDVVVAGDRAYVYYFIHPMRNGPQDGYNKRRSLIQVTEIKLNNGWLTCDRDAPTFININEAKKSKGYGNKKI